MKKINIIITITVIIIVIISVLGYLNFYNRIYKKGQIDALKGEYKYKQVVYYEWIYDNYYSVDTVYLEIKNNK